MNMDNWENNLIAKKLNSLLDLPEGYAPNLASKWEIIEAGRPKEKRIAPLFKWHIAAALIIGIVLAGIFIKFSFNEQTIALQLSNTQKHVSTVKNLSLKPQQKIINIQSIDLDQINKHKLIVKNNLDKNQSIINQNKKIITIDTISVLASTKTTTAIIPSPILTPLLINLNTVQLNKPVKRKIYQKDFNDNVLKIEDANMASQTKQAGLKVQFLKHADNNTDQSSSVLQWQKSF